MKENRPAVLAWRLSHDCEVNESDYEYLGPAVLSPEMETINAEIRAKANLSAQAISDLTAGKDTLVGGVSDKARAKREARKKAKRALETQQQQKKPEIEPEGTPDSRQPPGSKRPVVEREPPIEAQEQQDSKGSDVELN